MLVYCVDHKKAYQGTPKHIKKYGEATGRKKKQTRNY